MFQNITNIKYFQHLNDLMNHLQLSVFKLFLLSLLTVYYLVTWQQLIENLKKKNDKRNTN